MNDNGKNRTELVVAIIGFIQVIIGGLLANWDKVFSKTEPLPSTKGVLTILGYTFLVIGAIILAIYLLKILLGPERFTKHILLAHIVRDGLSFFNAQLESLAKSGGEIFTTAIFENYSHGDKVREQLLKIKVQKNNPPQSVVFTRFVILDDPTQELKWIKDFLSLGDEINPDENGFTLSPEVIRIPSGHRSFIQRLVESMPRITLTLIKKNKRGEYQVYFGFPNPPELETPNFGLCFRSKKLHELSHSFINKYIRGLGNFHVDKYTNINQLPNIDYSEIGLTLRIIDGLISIAQIRKEEILHIGLFGSMALLYRNQISINERAKEEADLDLVVVINQKANIDEFKNQISKHILKQRLATDQNIEIEWSNLEGKYYVYRHEYHIDIQIHFANDPYYTSKAELLGYSIFGPEYVVLHTYNDQPLNNLLPIPARPLPQRERISLCLNSDEYGIQTMLDRLGHANYISTTDPRRILWIAIANSIWAIEGERPKTIKDAIKYLSTYWQDFDPSRFDCDTILNVIQFDEPKDAEASRKLHERCRLIVQAFKEKLIEKNNRV